MTNIIPRTPQPSMQLSPFAMLAAVLFNLNKTTTIKVKPDDSQEEVDVQARIVGIQVDGDDAAICVMPLESVIHFMQFPYDVKVKVDNGHVLISFEKQSDAPTILTQDGNKIALESDKIDKLLERMR